MNHDDWIVVVPVIAPRAETAAARATWDINAPNICLIDNTPTGEYVGGPWEYEGGDGQNLGVAASWNRGVNRGKEFTVIISSYMEFDEGLAKTVERLIEASNEYGCLSWQACHVWAFTRKTFDLCGSFDPNYYPAYFEDVAMLRVMELAGCHNAANPMPKIAVSGICPQAKSLELGLAKPNMDRLRAYYHACWGGDPFKETFTHPFNDETKPISWHPEPPDPRSIIGQ